MAACVGVANSIDDVYICVYVCAGIEQVITKIQYRDVPTVTYPYWRV